MKPFVDPTSTPIEAPIDDDLSEPFLDESDIPAESFEASESSSHYNDSNVTAEDDKSSLLHSQEAHNSSNLQVDVIKSLLIINKVLLLEKFSKKVKEKAKCNISLRLNGLTISKINRPGNGRKYLDKRLIEHFEHGQKRRQRESNSQHI